MIQTIKISAITATALLLAACVSSPELTSDQISQMEVEVESYGVYKVSQVKEVDNDTYVAGSSLEAKKFELVEQVDLISAKAGTTFGTSFSFNNLPENQKNQFRLVMKFPEMTDPDSGMTQTYYESSEVIKNGTTRFKGFTFEYDWELVKGEWIYQVYYKDTLLAEKSFNVN